MRTGRANKRVWRLQVPDPHSGHGRLIDVNIHMVQHETKRG